MQKTVVVVEPEHTFIIIIIHVHHETRTQREVISGGIGSQSKSHALPSLPGWRSKPGPVPTDDVGWE